MRPIVPDVYLIEGLRSAHAFLLASEEGLTLVDSGMPGEADQITAQLEEGGFALADLRTIVLTHCHSDHTGNVAELARRSGARVLAHQDEVAYIEGKESLPQGSIVQRLMNWVMDRISRLEPCPVDRALQDGEMVEALGGLQVVHAPGHTPGSIALYQPERRILFSGDVLFHGSPMGRGQDVQTPPTLFSVDAAQAEISARKVAALPVEVVCFAHGEPILERAQERLREALD